MNTFDIIVLLIVGIGAVSGFVRGFVEEALSLAAWVLTLFVIHTLHMPVTVWLAQTMENTTTASVVAFALLLIVPYAGIKLVASWLGRRSRASVLGPVDRVLGFGFGVLKGIIIVVLAFSILVLGYDTVWGVAGRPSWITTARTYPFLSLASDELVQVIRERRVALEKQDQQFERDQ